MSLQNNVVQCMTKNLGKVYIKGILKENHRYSSVCAKRALSTSNTCHDNVSATSTDTITPAVKPYTDLPGPKYRVPIVGQVLDILKYRGKGHIGIQDALNTFGPILKINVFGVVEFVYLGDEKDIETLHRQDGRTPKRLILDIWKDWRVANGHKLGLLISEGEDWKQSRVALDKQMLRPQVVHKYADDFNEVITDLFKYVRAKRDEEGAIDRLDQMLFRWSLEGMAKVLYGVRLGNFTEAGSDPEIAEFIQSVHDLFLTTEYLGTMPKWLRHTWLRKQQRKHDEAWRIMFRTGTRIIDQTLTRIKEELERGAEPTGFLASLQANDSMHTEEIYANISELMLAAVDTTSNTMQWALYHLSENPDKLARLQQEVLSITPQGTVPIQSHINRMPYLKSVIKEVLRLVPVAGVITRTTRQDMVLGGYHIPADTKIIGCVYQMGRNPDNYEGPNSFMPERWLREHGQRKHSYAWLPFGHGPRMCIGKRVAELEMHLLLARLVQEFDLQPGDNSGLEIVTKGLLQPSKPVQIKFKDRL